MAKYIYQVRTTVNSGSRKLAPREDFPYREIMINAITQLPR